MIILMAIFFKDNIPGNKLVYGAAGRAMDVVFIS